MKRCSIFGPVCEGPGQRPTHLHQADTDVGTEEFWEHLLLTFCVHCQIPRAFQSLVGGFEVMPTPQEAQDTFLQQSI